MNSWYCLQHLHILASALALPIVVHQENISMVYNKQYSIGLIWLVFSLLVLLVACSSTDTLPKPTPTSHSVRTLASGNGGGTGRIALACAPDPAQHKPDICVSNLDGSGLRRLTSEIGRAHVLTPVTRPPRMPSS